MVFLPSARDLASFNVCASFAWRGIPFALGPDTAGKSDARVKGLPDSEQVEQLATAAGERDGPVVRLLHTAAWGWVELATLTMMSRDAQESGWRDLNPLPLRPDYTNWTFVEVGCVGRRE